MLVGYPLLNESTGNSCVALEKRWYTVAVLSENKSLVESAVIRSLIEAGEGLFAREYARKERPEIPPVVTCYYYYWRSFLDNDWLRNIKPSQVSESGMRGGDRIAIGGAET
jgi:hypothetical protein